MSEQVNKPRTKREKIERDGDVLRVFLPCGRIMLADAQDEEIIRAHSWYSSRGVSSMYAISVVRAATSRKRLGFAHRLILKPPRGMDVDHINRDGLDNRRENLRICTRSQNRMNSVGKAGARKSKYKGIWEYSYANTYWCAEVSVAGEKYRVNGCLSEVEAAAFYDLMARKYHGEFALLNFPGGIPNDIDLGPNPEARVTKRQKGGRAGRRAGVPQGARGANPANVGRL